MNLSEKIIDTLQRRRWIVLFFVVLSCVFATKGALKVGIDNSLEIWFSEEDPQLQSYHQFQQEFGNDEVVILALHSENEIFTPENMAALHRLTVAAEGVEGIEKAESLAVLSDLHISESGPVVAPLYQKGVDFNTRELRQRVQENPLLHGRLVSKDGKTALVMATMASNKDIDSVRDGILKDLRQEVESTGLKVSTAGMGVIYSALNQAALVDSQVFIGASNLLIFLLLGLMFRRVVPVLLTLAVIGVATLWMMGLYGAAGKSTNMVTMVLPTLMLIIGVSDCVHFLSHASKPVAGMDRAERVRKGLAFMLRPCLVNSLTTAAGFLALSVAPMPIVRDLGIFAALGVLGAFLAALIGCSIGMMWQASEPKVQGANSPKPWVSRFVERMAQWATGHPRRVVAGATGLLLLAIAGISQLTVDTTSIGFLKDNHIVNRDNVAIERDFGPTTPLEFLVRLEKDLSDPQTADTLHAIANWQDAMAERPEVGWTRSQIDVFRRMNQVAGNGFGLPEDPAALGDLIRASSALSKQSALLSGDQLTLRVTAGIPMGSARTFEKYIATLSGLAELPSTASLEATGYLPLYVSQMESLVTSQLSSFSLAFVIIFFMLALLFKSVRLSALAIPANLIPVLLILGIMGFAGIALDVATVTISAVVLGLVVDDTTQFLYRYNFELEQHNPHEIALKNAIQGAGQALATTSLVLGLGFLVLTLTAIKSIAFFGLLCAIALLVALLGDLLLLPAILMLVGPPNAEK
jgi:predicted RND superfamily exporter protein